MKYPIISVCRRSRLIGLFDGPNIVKDFEPYTHEGSAVVDAQNWFKERTEEQPRIVYPQITKMTCS